MLTFTQRRRLATLRRLNRARARELLANMKKLRFWIDLFYWPVMPLFFLLVITGLIGATLGIEWFVDRLAVEYTCQKKVGE